MQTNNANFVLCFPDISSNYRSLIRDKIRNTLSDISLERRPIIQRIVVTTTTIRDAMSDISLEQRPIIQRIVVSKQHRYKGNPGKENTSNPHFEVSNGLK